MDWLEAGLLSAGIALVGTGLLLRFGMLRAERDPAVVARSARVAWTVMGLGAVMVLVHLVVVRV